MNAIAAFILGAALAACTAAGAALLLYTTRGFLGTAGFLFALALAALSFGLWAGHDGRAGRRRWIGVVVAYVAAGLFTLLWGGDETFRRSGFGGALAAFFLLAEPAYTTGAAFSVVLRRNNTAGVAGFAGAALGVLLATLLLIPKLHASVIFISAAALLLIVALLHSRRIPKDMTEGTLPLTGKTVIVTGVGDRGQVGFAVAQAAVRAGAQVCISALHENTLATEIAPNVHFVAADLNSEDDVARLIASVQERFGAIDALVNLAGGLSVIKPLAETSKEEWHREAARNADTVFLVSRAALPQLRERRGAIVNFASPAGLKAVGTLGAYSAAKASVVALTRALAVEEAGRVRVNAIAPGMIDTEQNRRSAADPSAVKWVTREEVAAVVVFLLSDGASAVTGETIQVLGSGIE